MVLQRGAGEQCRGGGCQLPARVQLLDDVAHVDGGVGDRRLPLALAASGRRAAAEHVRHYALHYGGQRRVRGDHNVAADRYLDCVQLRDTALADEDRDDVADDAGGGGGAARVARAGRRRHRVQLRQGQLVRAALHDGSQRLLAKVGHLLDAQLVLDGVHRGVRGRAGGRRAASDGLEEVGRQSHPRQAVAWRGQDQLSERSCALDGVGARGCAARGAQGRGDALGRQLSDAGAEAHAELGGVGGEVAAEALLDERRACGDRAALRRGGGTVRLGVGRQRARGGRPRSRVDLHLGAARGLQGRPDAVDDLVDEQVAAALVGAARQGQVLVGEEGQLDVGLGEPGEGQAHARESRHGDTTSG